MILIRLIPVGYLVWCKVMLGRELYLLMILIINKIATLRYMTHQNSITSSCAKRLISRDQADQDHETNF